MKMISLSAMPASFGCILLIGSILCVLLCVQVSDGQQKFCGKTLNEAMDMVCRNGYNEKISATVTKKRMAIDPDDDLQMEYDAETANFPHSIYTDDHFADLNPLWMNIYENVLAKTRRRRMGGVYDECCRKGCTYTEMAAYCRPL